MQTLISPLKKKGQLGMDTAKTFLLGIFAVVVIGFAIIISITQLNNSNPFASGSTNANLTTGILNNVSTGTATFFGNAGSWFSMLAIVVLLLIIGAVIFAVNSFGGRA